MHPTSYRLGLSIVVGTILGFAALRAVAVPMLPEKAPTKAPEWSLGAFRLTERSGREITQGDLSDQVWVASFIFTRCKMSCPRISAVNKALQDKFAGTDVRLVSITVDPEHDSPEVLKAYADTFAADPARWWFLTGPKEPIRELVMDRFLMPMQAVDESIKAAGLQDIGHSSRLILVDRGNWVVETFNADDPTDVESLTTRARKLDGGWVRRLPAVNATLNATCAGLLLLGWGLIRTGRARGHAACMIACLTVSALFLTCYLVYHFQVGSVPFRGTGTVRNVYFTILLSHTTLAAAMVPLVILTVLRAARKRFDAHRRIASLTFPIWVYVSVTGVVVYYMLYQMDVSVPVPPLIGGISS